MDFKILYLIDKLHHPILDKIMLFFTNLGDAGIVWIAIAILLLVGKKTRKCGIYMLVSMGIGLLLGNVLLKNIVARQRPCWLDHSIELLIASPKDFSFPSGHTLASFEAAVMIFLFSKKWGIVAFLLAIVIAFSRMYLFVHFPSDILGGALLGTAISLFVYHTAKKIEEKKKQV